jgi:ADP-heptose:LPS heptosyltransferase
VEARGLGRIVLSEGPAERDRALVAALRPWPVIRGLDLAALGEVFRGASLVVAPSTGPLHLAHFVGTATLGIYSPVRTQRARRWAPWGGAGRSLIWAPDVDCPGMRDCRGAKCEHFSCLEVMARGGLPSVLADALNGVSGD